MKRYHPDKHVNKHEYDDIGRVDDEINQICMTTNKMYEVLIKV